MKILNKIWGITFLALLLIAAAPNKSKAQDENITEQDFYDNLEPYGTWVSDPQYGDVWVPDVEGDFRPYATQGHWVLTPYGNTWVSSYPWGWATFHYGRWRYDDYYGWEWIPGYEWAPAWVSWRHGGGYYGWAPLMPGISLSISFGSGYRVPYSYWAFAPERYINRPNIYNYYVPHARTVTIIRNTTIINNTYVNGGRRYIAGPRAADIQRYTRQRPQIYNINNVSRPGTMSVQNNTVNIFRPVVSKAPDARPRRVVDANAYRQQNPNLGIARKGPGGGAGFNRENAVKLATVARNTNDNNNLVRVNSRPNNGSQQGVRPDQQNARPDQQGNRRSEQQNARPDQQGNRRPEQQGGNVAKPVQPVTQPTPGQQGGQPAFTPSNGRGRPEDRPNVRPPAQQQNNNLQQQQQTLNDEQRTLHGQKRQEFQREQQRQNLPQGDQAQPVSGLTPTQQQQMAIRGQQRALREQQRQQAQQQSQQNQPQQQQGGQVQQPQRDQQRPVQQQGGQAQQPQQQGGQAQQAQRDQQRQAQQQGQQAQQAQRDQQRQAQQQAQQAQNDQQKQAQQQAQRDQQRQAQQAQNDQQKQAQQAQRDQQKQAQQAQRDQQRQAQPQKQTQQPAKQNPPQQRQQQRRPPEQPKPQQQ